MPPIVIEPQALVTQQISVLGITPNLVVVLAAVGVTVTPDARVFLLVRNGSEADITATVNVPGTEYGVQREDVPVVIPAGGERFIGPLTRDLATGNGLVQVLFDDKTSLTVAACRV